MTAALIAAISALIISIITYFTNRKNQQELENLRARLAIQKSENDARRDYEYEARKRLYEECEPLIFQMIELSENALHRIFSLARTARQGNLPSWLKEEDYYLYSTIYNLLAPLTMFQLMRDRLTIIDLTVEPRIKTQYQLMKQLYLTFTEDFALANQQPILKYDPFDDDWAEKRESNPQVYWRQGLPIGLLDNAVQSMMIRKDNNERCVTYGQFELAFKANNSEYTDGLKRMIDVFRSFHPKTRPILWRILITQAVIYNALINTQYSKWKHNLIRFDISDDLATSCNWIKTANNKIPKDAMVPFMVAKQFLESKFDTFKY